MYVIPGGWYPNCCDENEEIYAGEEQQGNNYTLHQVTDLLCYDEGCGYVPNSIQRVYRRERGVRREKHWQR